MFRIKPMSFDFALLTLSPRKCSAPGCPNTFQPNRSNQIYCGKKCRDFAFRKKYGPAGKPTKILSASDQAISDACRDALLHATPLPVASATTEAFKTLDLTHPTYQHSSTKPSTAEDDLMASWSEQNKTFTVKE